MKDPSDTMSSASKSLRLPVTLVTSCLGYQSFMILIIVLIASYFSDICLRIVVVSGCFDNMLFFNTSFHGKR